MTRREEVDVLVVGGGPAGSMAAREAALGGLKVLLVDAKRRIGGHPHCAEFAPRFLALELDFPERCVAQGIEAMETRLPLRSAVTPAPGFILDRSRFDHGLAEAAALAGAEIRAGTRLVDRAGDCWRLHGPGGQTEIACRLVVAADGAGSRTRKLLGLPAQSRLTGVQVEVPLARASDRTLVLFDPEWRHGYAWLFPKDRVANLGLGMRESRPGEAWTALSRLVERLLDQGLIRPGFLARSVGAIPVSGLGASLAQDHVLLAGDAAGLTHPITGAGIPQAVFSGRAAGRAAVAFILQDRTSALIDYDREIRLRFGPALARALEKRHRFERDWSEPDFSALAARSWPAFKDYRIA